MEHLSKILSHFLLSGTADQIEPLGNGLINDTYRATTREATEPDYVFQRINNNVFTDVDLLQHNIEAVTAHIRRKLEADHTDDIERRVLRFVPTREGKTYYQAEDGTYWRVSVFIPRARTLELVDPTSSRFAGEAFGHFEAMLTDLTEPLGETIPDFHNMELRIRQLREAVDADAAGRLASVQPLVDQIEQHADDMCKAERMHREGLLPKRICHCDTKVNNMMFNEQGDVLCVIDLDTVMPSYVFSDYGDFLRTAANTVAEDSPELDKIAFRMDIFRAFTEGYIHATRPFLTPVERDNLPYAAALFPYMQCVRFLADYINGDTYYKTAYADHNLVRARNQWRLFESATDQAPAMHRFIDSLT